MRLMWPTLQDVEARVGALEHAFAPVRSIWLRRLDMVGQALSRLKAEVSGTWHPGFEEAKQPAEMVYDFAQIKSFRDEGEADSVAWGPGFALGVSRWR